MHDWYIEDCASGWTVLYDGDRFIGRFNNRKEAEEYIKRHG